MTANALNTAAKELEALIIVACPPMVSIKFGDHRNTRTSPSIEMVIRNGQAKQMSVGAPGSNLVRYVGIVIFSIFTEGGKGDAEANGIADTIMDVYRNQVLATVHTKIPYPVARKQEGKFFSMDVFVPYHRDAYEA